MWWSPSLFGLQLEVYSCAVFTKLRGWEREQKQKEIRISQREEAVNMCRVRWCGAGAATSTRGRTPRGHAASEPWLHSIFLPFFSLNLFSKKKNLPFYPHPGFFRVHCCEIEYVFLGVLVRFVWFFMYTLCMEVSL